MIAALSSLIPPGLFEAIFQTLLHSLWQIPVIALALKLYSQRLSLRSSFGSYNASFFAIVMSILVAGFTFLFFLLRQEDTSILLGATKSVEIHFSNALGTIIPSSTSAEGATIIDFIGIYKNYIVLFWAIGFIFFTSRITAGWIGIQLIKKSLTFKVSDDLNASFSKIKNVLHLEDTIRLAHSALISIPMVIGHARPIIILPLATINGLTTEEVEAILVHEMAHIVHYDFLKNIIIMLGEALFFYHPVIWLLTSEIKEEREHCCDDTVMKHFPNRIGYAKMLVKLEEIQMGRSTRLSLALFNSKFKLMKRVKRILNTSNEPRLKWTNLAILGLLVGSLIVFSSAGFISDLGLNKDKASGIEIETALQRIVDTPVLSDPTNTKVHESASNPITEDATEISNNAIASLNIIPNPVSLILPELDTLDKEEKEKLKKKLKEKSKELREKTRELRDKMRAQAEKIRAEYKDELKIKKKELKEIKKKLEKEGHSFNIGDDDDFEFHFDSEGLEEWASKMGEWGAELGEKVAAQFDDKWVAEIADMGAEIGGSIGDIFDEDWAAKWEKQGQSFKFNMDNTFNDEWAEEMAAMGSEIAASFDEEWIEGITDMSKEISDAVIMSLEDYDEEDFNYNFTFGEIKDSKALKSNLVSMLNKDGLLTDEKNTIIITDDAMKVNGVVQPTSLLSSYQDIVKLENSDAFVEGKTTVKFVIDGTSLDGSNRTVLSVQVEE